MYLWFSRSHSKKKKKEKKEKKDRSWRSVMNKSSKQDEPSQTRKEEPVEDSIEYWNQKRIELGLKPLIWKSEFSFYIV